jgi:hypothetical protein
MTTMGWLIPVTFTRPALGVIADGGAGWLALAVTHH